MQTTFAELRGLHRAVRTTAALVLSSTLVSCHQKGGVPPITPSPTGTQLAGKAVWHDMITLDLAKSKAFYSALFGWQFKDIPTKDLPYAVASLNGVPVAGFVAGNGKGVNNSQWLTYFSVADVGQTAKAVTAAGGRVFRDVTDVPQRGQHALLADPQGAAFGVLRSASGDPPDTTLGPVNGWLWNELWTRDTAAAATFYTTVLGYKTGDAQALHRVTGTNVVSSSYTVFTHDGRPRAGLVFLPVPEVRPNWLPTLRVADVGAVVTRATQLGGRVVLAPRPDVRRGTLAIIADPSGAAVAIQQMPTH
jgi:predicted enzyme related to lactoylglutathione lyase